MINGIYKIDSYDKLRNCLAIIVLCYKKRDEELKLREDIHRHTYLSFDELKTMYDKGIKMYGYYDNDIQVGFVSFDIRETNIKIKDIVVFPNYQNKGIGKELLNFVKEIAIKENKKKLVLGMIDANEKLKNWYLKYGFVITDIITYPTQKVAYLEYDLNKGCDY